MRQKFSLFRSVNYFLAIFSISNVFCTVTQPLVKDPTLTDPRKSIEMVSMDASVAPKTLADIAALSELMKTGKVARAVAFPGGGIRGIIQAGIAEHIEKNTGLSFVDIFNMMSGTSTGAIIATALSAPSKEDPTKPRMQASETKELYMHRGREIFKELSLIERIFSLFTSKYSAKPLERILYEMCGDLKLSDALIDLLITVYNKTLGRGEIMKSHLAQQVVTNARRQTSVISASAASNSSEPFVHHAATLSLATSSTAPEKDSHRAHAKTVTESVSALPPDKDEPAEMPIAASNSLDLMQGATLSPKIHLYRDFLLRDILRATSAALSYFPVARISPIGGGKYEIFSAIDGGFFANDPTLFTLIEMFRLYPNADAYFMLTIGNGSTCYKEKPVIGIWDIALQMPDIFMGGDFTSQRHIMKVLGPQYNKPVYFVEFQMRIPAEHAEMDDVSPANMQFLQQVAQTYIQTTPLVGKIITELLSLPKTPRKELVASASTAELPFNFHIMR